MQTFSRREFLVISGAALGGLVVGFRTGGAARAEEASPAGFVPNGFIRIGDDGRVTLVMPQAEMGQGVYTSMSMLLAEELEVELGDVWLEHAPADNALYANALFGEQLTGASSSVRAFYEPLRRAGAAARTLLVAAAAQAWGVDPVSCRAQSRVVTHTETGRTLAYGALAGRAAKLPAPSDVQLKDPKQFRLIGTPARRLDTPEKIDGRAEFGIDVRLPGMKIATVAASPVVGGTLASVDEEKARTIAGVRQIVRLDDAVAVVADHMWAARQGLSALTMRWEDGPNGKVSTADVVRELEAASRKPGVVARREGDAAAAIAAATTRVDATYEVPFLAHAALEPINCTVHVREDGCEVWTGTQVIARAQATAAQVTGLPLEKVVVHNRFLGGGFGRRLEHDYVTQAVRIAQQVKGPVKVVWSREEDIRHDVYRPYYYDRIAAGLDERGMPVAWSHRIVGPAIFARFAPPAFRDGIDPDAVDAAVQLLYSIPSLQIEHVRHEEPVLNTGFWRGVGPTHTVFVIESFMDELAAAAKADPVEYRRALLVKAPRARAVLDLAANAADWGKPLPAGRGRGVALLYSEWGTYAAQIAEVELSKEGEIRVHRVVCAVDCGIAVNPDIVKAQVESGVVFGTSAALWGEITLENGRVAQSNFSDYRVLRMNETPVIDVHLLRSDEAPGGIGEVGTPPIAPALANAIFAATGQRLRKLPLRPTSLALSPGSPARGSCARVSQASLFQPRPVEIDGGRLDARDFTVVGAASVR